MFLTPTSTGIRLATSGTSAGAVFPTSDTPSTIRTYRVSATAPAHIRMGIGAQTAVNTDFMVQPGEPVMLRVPPGITHIAALQVSGTGIVQISPLD